MNVPQRANESIDGSLGVQRHDVPNVQETGPVFWHVLSIITPDIKAAPKVTACVAVAAKKPSVSPNVDLWRQTGEHVATRYIQPETQNDDLFNGGLTVAVL